MSCDQAHESLGVYVLGALEPPERAELDRHLAGCPACREELAGLADLPRLLGRLTLADVTGELSATPDQPVGQPSPQLLDRLLTRTVARDHRRRRALTHRRRQLSVAAAAVVLVGGAVGVGAVGVGAVGVGVHSMTGGSSPTTTAADPVTHVALRATLHHREWGTAIDVRLHGVAPGERCRLLAVDRAGRAEVTASWQANYEGEADVTGATGIPRASLTTLRVVTEDNRQLVVLPVAS